MADNSQTQFASIAESTYGTTPSTPNFIKRRYVSDSLKIGRDTIQSNEITPNRNVTDLIQVGGNATGSVEFELSYGEYDDWLESALQGTWSSDVLVNASTQKSFTHEKLVENGATDDYFRFEGALADTFSLNIRAKEIVTGSFGWLCEEGTLTQAAIASSTYDAAGTNDVMNAGTGFASLAITGVTSPAILGITLEVTNNLRQKPVVGSLSSYGIGNGQFEVKGTIEAYFENAEMLDLFYANTATDLTFKVGGASSKNYVFNIPNLKFSDGEAPTGGNNTDVIQTLQFTGLYDSGIDGTLEITRTA